MMMFKTWVVSAYERGFQAGQASAVHEQKERAVERQYPGKTRTTPVIDEFGCVRQVVVPDKPLVVSRIGLVELSKRLGIEDLNEVKALADRECVGSKSGFRDMAWFVGHEKATSRSDYDLAAVEAYEGRIQRRLLNGRIGLDLAESKAAKKAKG